MRQALVSRTFDEGTGASGPAPSPAEIAGKFPQFEIIECLGRGGMGVVYKARQKSLNRTVAIKVLAPEREHDARFAERFAREAELLAKLNHPNIVTIHDFGETGGLYYIVMEFIDGVNLRDLLRDGKIDPKQALAIVPPVCEALQFAHDHGVVHRDIKPENLLLDRAGRIKIADFGIAGLVGADGERSGTPAYMAPEQSGPEVDHRADIYALGVVLYEMLTGERPAENVVAPSRKIEVDVKIDEMVLRALEKEPELRYQTAGEFRTVAETLGTDGAGRSPEIPRSVLDAMSADPANWRWRFFYHCAGDPRLVVPKRLRGFGWTINFAQLWAIPFLAAVILVLLGSMRLAVATGYTSTANLLPLTLGLVAAVIGVCHNLSKGPVAREGYPPVHVRSLITAGIAFGLVLLLGNWHPGRSPAAGLTAKAWQVWRSGKPAEARPMFEEAVKVAPGDPDAWNGLGWSCFNSGDPKAGEEAFRRSVGLDPDHAAALNGLGQIALARHDYVGAEPFLLKSAGRGATAAWHGLARLYLLTGDFAQAERWAGKLVGSGGADELGQQMLDAAKARELPEDLERMIGGSAPRVRSSMLPLPEPGESPDNGRTPQPRHSGGDADPPVKAVPDKTDSSSGLAPGAAREDGGVFRFFCYHSPAKDSCGDAQPETFDGALMMAPVHRELDEHGEGVEWKVAHWLEVHDPPNQGDSVALPGAFEFQATAHLAVVREFWTYEADAKGGPRKKEWVRRTVAHITAGGEGENAPVLRVSAHLDGDSKIQSDTDFNTAATAVRYSPTLITWEGKAIAAIDVKWQAEGQWLRSYGTWTEAGQVRPLGTYARALNWTFGVWKAGRTPAIDPGFRWPESRPGFELPPIDQGASGSKRGH